MRLMTNKCFPFVGHNADRTGPALEHAGDDVGALAQKVFYVPFQIAGDFLHAVICVYGDHFLPLKRWGAAGPRPRIALS